MHSLAKVWTLVALMAGVLWSYWPTLVLMVRSWTRDPVHNDFGPSHGGFVPVFALIVLWSRREMFHEAFDDAARFRWYGLAILLATLPIRWFAGYTDYVALDAFTLLPALAGLTLLVGGRGGLSVAWPAIAMLFLMLPWPYRVELAVTDPLRHFVAAASTFLLQTLGYPIFVEGPIMRIENIRVEVIDACSGLGMLLTFFALALTIALLSRAPLANRLIMLGTSPFFAVLANVLRISATGAAYYAWGPSPDTTHVHDLAGWLMMPVALLLLWLELRLLDHLLIPQESSAPLSMMLPGEGTSSMPGRMLQKTTPM